MIFKTNRLVAKTNLQIEDGKIILDQFGFPAPIDLLNLAPSTPENDGFAFYDKQSEAFICHVGFQFKRGKLEVSYGTQEPYRNKGYMCEALSFVITWFFDNTSEEVLWAITSNPISKSVLLKCGFSYYGPDEDSKTSEWYVIGKNNI